MKSVKNVFLMLGLVVVSTMMFASPKNNIINSEGKQIQKMLISNNIMTAVDKDTKVNISFLVNGQNEIIVLSTNNQDLDQAIKSALNYQKISVSELEYNTVYTLPVSFK
ncbi:MAG: hypothetical protein IPN79_15370 [Saprospiraceae bacterium]|jgi:hypothetical protein|nr:hypothetical protein [Saprospiraceae bacterium]